jgi:hypothetical protein
MSTATFDPLTAAIAVNSAQGTSTMRPPFDSQEQINKYGENLEKVSALKTKNVTYIQRLDDQGEGVVQYKSDDLPGVSVYNIIKPPIFAVVYTDINGNSSFSYKNDPQNRITLTKSGSEIPALKNAENSSAAAPANNIYYTEKKSAAEPAAIIVGAICWCLSILSSMCVIGVLIYMTVKRN